MSALIYTFFMPVAFLKHVLQAIILPSSRLNKCGPLSQEKMQRSY